MTEVIRYTYCLQNPIITTDKVDAILSDLSNDENVISISWGHASPERQFLPITKIVAVVQDAEKYIGRLYSKFSARFVFPNREDIKYRLSA